MPSQTDNSLKYSQNILNSLLDIAPCNIYWKDKDHKVLGCNKSQLEMLGLKKQEEFVGRAWAKYATPEQIGNILANDNLVLESGETITFEEEFIFADNTPRIFLSKKTPIYDNDKNIIGMLGVSFDITEIKDAQNSKRVAYEKSIEYLRLASGALAHDLRTPLSSIKNVFSGTKKFLDILINAYKVAKKENLIKDNIRTSTLKTLENAFDRGIHEVDYANRYINMMLDNLKYNKISKKQYHVVNLNQCINKALELYPFRDDEKSLIHWDSAKDFQFYGNENYVINIINNLIKNALYFIKESKKGNINIWAEQQENNNVLYFKDTAKGASQEIIDHMFEGFYTHTVGGTGLGLAFCKAIMESFGGTIKAKSLEGEYMLFILNFPKI